MNIDDILDRAGVLKELHASQDRNRIRAVMNGGALGVQSVLNYGGTPYQGPGSETHLHVNHPCRHDTGAGPD